MHQEDSVTKTEKKLTIPNLVQVYDQMYHGDIQELLPLAKAVPKVRGDHINQGMHCRHTRLLFPWKKSK